MTKPRVISTQSRESSPSPGFLGRLAGFVLRHRRLIIIGWAVMFVAGGIAAGQVSKRLSVDFSLPGQPGYETGLKILHTWGNGGETEPDILVVSVPKGQSVAGDNHQIATAFNAVRESQPGLRVVDYASTNDSRFVTRDGQATFAYLFAPLGHSFGISKASTVAMSEMQRLLPGYSVGLTGINQLQSTGSSTGPGVLLETMIGGIGALAVLAFVFASLLAFVPLAVAAVSILSTFLVIWGLTYLTDVSFIVEFLIALVGLGVSIDYSLLLVTRWREERAKGADNHTAVIRAVETAGRAVFLSGLTVAIGLMALVVLPVPGLRSVGIGGMLIPLISIIVVDTLLPAILGGIGPRVDWPRIRKEASASRSWSSWSRMITRNRWGATAAALVILGLSIIPIFGLKVGETGVSALASSGPAHDAYETLVAGGVPGGVLTPLEILTSQVAAPKVVSQARGVLGIVTATLPSGSTGSRRGLSDIIAIPDQPTVNNTTLTSVNAAKSALDGQPGVVGIAGLGPTEEDYSHAVFGNFPLMFAIIAILTFLLLARAFRSLLLALKAVLLNLVSLAATFGLLTWFWQEGNGSQALFGIPATGAITFWVPLMVFAFLFGLSMDYEVFILTRVREEYDRTGNTNEAVIEGLGRTGRLVTSAALILFLAFASLASAPDTDLKVMATGLGAGILLDATVVRALLVPALVSLLGKWNWWLPRPIAKILAIRATSIPATSFARQPEVG